MLKEHSSQNVNRVVQLYDPRSGIAAGAILPEDYGIARRTPVVWPDLPESCPAAISTVAAGGYALTSLWWSVLASFLEGFGAYGASMYLTADYPVPADLPAKEASPQHPAQRGPTATGHVHGTALLYESKNVIQLGSVAALDARLPRHRSLLAFLYDATARLWAHWRREREIKRAVAALTQFDDRTLRDMGISSRSEIELAVRYCHDC
jgi:uncharacterized protein YjiS (DUF1127 family)